VRGHCLSSGLPVCPDIDDGTYVLGVGPKNEIGEATKYGLTVSEGGSRAVEVFVREGVTRRYESAVSEAVESPVRNDMGQSSDGSSLTGSSA
jgi:hypothetical protein